MTYRTIVADPPWRYDDPGIRGGTDPHYGTMSVEAITDLRPNAADDAHLYLWTTNPFLPASFAIVEAWGFRYVTTLTWHKLGAPGVGHYFRGDTEHVLFGVRGRLAIPPALRTSNHFAAARTRHSAKPDRFYELVERVRPRTLLGTVCPPSKVRLGRVGQRSPDRGRFTGRNGLVGVTVRGKGANSMTSDE